MDLASVPMWAWLVFAAAVLYFLHQRGYFSSSQPKSWHCAYRQDAISPSVAQEAKLESMTLSGNINIKISGGRIDVSA